MKQYNGKVRVVYKNFLIHPQLVQAAHQAGCAASMQGKFVQFKNEWWDKAFKNQRSDQQQIDEIAKDIGLNMARFEKDQNSEACKQRIEHDQQELLKFHVNSTPTFFVNGTHVGGAVSEPVFKQLIDQKLQTVKASGVPCSQYYQKEVMEKGEKQFRSKFDPKPS